ncbi:FHA domain-containing protein [Candidatus Poribacteria bacterium]|nr:FHA domain-containing protein [Candidatus Poribacteria bacterium]
MKTKIKLKANYSEELEKAEILEGYTKLISGEKPSRKQRKLLNNQRYEYEEEMAPLKKLVDFTHQQSAAMIMESVVPSPSASQRVETKLMTLIKGNQLPTPGFVGNLQPAYEMEPVGSDSELAQMEYEYNLAEEFISQGQQKRDCTLRFKIIEGDEIGREYLAVIPKIIPGRGKDVTSGLGEEMAMREITIGRGVKAQIRLLDSSGELSRVHAKLEARDSDIYIIDLNSSNGTYVDGEEITGSHKLSIGSTVRLGGIVIKILSIES